MSSRRTAPVAVFTYDRIGNTQLTLAHLMCNTLAAETDVYVFSDGGRDAKSRARVETVRTYLRALAEEVRHSRILRSMTLVERSENYYLERNITEGIAQVFRDHDTIIVLEDDIVTSPYFLQYMNEAFDLYRDERRVMHVSGFTNLDLAQRPFYFTPHMSGWGWGTWRDRWQAHFVHFATEAEALDGLDGDDRDAMQYGGVFPCLKSLAKRPIPWDICWEIAIRKARGLCLTPGRTLVRNVGLRSGTHFRSFAILQRYEFDREPRQSPVALTMQRPAITPEAERLFADAIRDWGIRYTWLGRIVRKIYRLVHKN